MTLFSESDPLNLTLERIQGRAATLFYSNMALITSVFFIISYSLNQQNEIAGLAAVALGMLFLWGYVYLFADFTFYYLSKANRQVKDLRDKHPLWFQGAAGVVLLGSMISALSYALGGKTVLGIIGGLALMISIEKVRRTFAKIYRKYFKKSS